MLVVVVNGAAADPDPNIVPDEAAAAVPPNVEVVVEVAADVVLPNADLPPANTELVVPAPPKTEAVEAVMTFGRILFEIVSEEGLSQRDFGDLERLESEVSLMFVSEGAVGDLHCAAAVVLLDRVTESGLA